MVPTPAVLIPLRMLFSPRISDAHSYTLFFFNDTATTEIYTLSLHDALPISRRKERRAHRAGIDARSGPRGARIQGRRSEEHTSELQSHLNLVCRLLLEKKKTRAKRLRSILR